MAKWPWAERTFPFDYPPAKLPELIERVCGTPARLEEMVRGLDWPTLTSHDGQGWSIQENIGHLLDTEYLAPVRIDQLLRGERELIAADMENRRTHEADHNARDISELLAAFRAERGKVVARFEQVPEENWGKSAVHPRLRVPMRIVDIASFVAEHDDYHLARIRQLTRTRRIVPDTVPPPF
jgi:hypothetical protein